MTKLIVANWKMNLGLAESLKLAKSYAKLFKKPVNQLAVCPSFLALPIIKDILSERNIALGAQDSFWETKGAYTGEVSPLSLQELGCQYVILGHSERRQYLGESCRMINAKAKAALATGLTPIVCVGEDATRHSSGKSAAFVTGQIKRALVGLKLSPKQSLVIAYEPIWAIGTGTVIKWREAQLMHSLIKSLAVKLLGSSGQIKVIYGGSVDSDNAATLLNVPEIDGFLVGGASLSAENFHKIANIK